MKVYHQEIWEYHALSPRTKEDNPKGCFPGSDSPFPGRRGEDQLIVYDQAYGQPTTGTNCWGVELLVDAAGRILTVAGGDSAIPENGFVVSGVGTAADRLLKVEPFGTRVSLDRSGGRIVWEVSGESLLASAQLAVEQLQEELGQARQALLDIDYTLAEQKLADARQALSQLEALTEAAGEAERREAAQAVKRVCAQGHLACQPSLRVEKRAVWYRAMETSEAAVEKTLRYAKDAGLTAIYLETWIEGHSIWPSEIPGIEMWPDLQGFDALGAFVRVGHRLGLEIHAWVETFLIGVVPHSEKGKPGAMERYAPLALTHPDWLLESRQGLRYSNRVYDRMDMYFFNPMEEGARNLVSAVYQEMASRYELDGVSFDYVRFPEPNDPVDGKMDDFGYNSNLVGAYRQQYGTDPYTITEDHPEWRQWCHFRAEQINTFVYRVADEMRKMGPHFSLSVSIFANYEVAMTLKYQETMDWVSKGYIDEVFTMSYYMDEQPVIEETRDTIRRADDMAYASTGISAGLGVSEETFLRQLKGIRSENAAGSAFFALAEFRGRDYGRLLRASLYRHDAIASPDQVRQSVPAMLSEILRKVREIYIPLAGGTEQDYETAQYELALAAARVNPFDSDGSRAMLETIAGLLTRLEQLSVGEPARQQLRRDLERTAYLLRVHQKRLTAREHA